MSNLKRILVATDFSPASGQAIEEGIALARALGAELTVLHAWFAPMWAMPDGGMVAPDGETVAQLSRWSKEELDRVRVRCVAAGVAVQTRNVEGPPADAIARVADEEHFDLVVVGTHGRTGMRHFLLGSVAEHVIRTCKVPVMTVHSAPVL